MDFYEVIHTRRSRRSYRPDPVPEDSLKRIADAVAHAPSACNRQPVKVLIVRNAELREKICSIYGRAFLKEAPVIAVVLGNESEAWIRPEGDSIVPVDAAIVMEHLVLAATAEGLGSCWICAFRRAELDRVLKLEGTPWKSVAMTPHGYSDAECKTNASKNINELFEVID